MKKVAPMTPTRLRLTLIIIMIFLVIAGGALFLYGRGLVADYAAEARTTAAKAQDSSKDLARLKLTQATLEKEAATVVKTNQLVAESQLYVYQDKIIEDITKYAADAGLSITNITFSDTKATATPATPPSTSAAATPSVPANIKSRIATVTLANPVDYYKLLNFIHSIEQGLFRMRIATIGISRSEKDNNSVTSDALSIEVYVR